MTDSFTITADHECQQFTKWRTARVQRFCQAWQQSPSLRTLINLQNASSAAIWQAVCYVEYEDLYSLFCTDASDFCQLASACFGQLLVDWLGMRWCRHAVFSHDFLLCFDDMPNHIIDVYALVFGRWQSVGSFELPCLLGDVILKFMYTSVFDDVYPLAPVLGLSWQNAQPVYQEQFGCAFDKAYHHRLNRLWQIDDQLLIRRLDDLPFSPPDGQLHWLKHTIEVSEHDLSERFGDGWQMLKSH